MRNHNILFKQAMRDLRLVGFSEDVIEVVLSNGYIRRLAGFRHKHMFVDFREYPSGGKWVVTHIPSGLIMGAYTERVDSNIAAVRFGKIAGPLLNRGETYDLLVDASIRVMIRRLRRGADADLSDLVDREAIKTDARKALTAAVRALPTPPRRKPTQIRKVPTGGVS